VGVYDVVNVGVAVHERQGLLVAVIEGADGLSLRATAERRRELQDRISASGVPPAAEGATFTITNLGHLGVRYFTPVLPPETSAILGVGKLEAVLPLSLTFDHQVVDGAPAAEFLQALGELIARPERWPEHWTVP
jgi:pyruvate dehydrogenase E2 component (dihydrolipoamide acetyltransferase)